MGVEVLQPPPWRLEEAYKSIFTPQALEFLTEMCRQFEKQVESLYNERTRRSAQLRSGFTPTFRRSKERKESWKIEPLPSRIQCRKVDLGDVSASNTAHFLEALNADAQGVQVDFDDGHCPTWRNQVLAHHNIKLCVSGKLEGAPSLEACPVLMLRPRAWNMIDHHLLVDGKEPPGALVDFALLMYHNAEAMHRASSGPYLYLSKIECAEEAKLWNDIFVWTQGKLGIPRGTIKACVLIENILSSFELDEILYSLREHSLGLNCGIWDYAASICAKFGWKRDFMLPDRNKYVNLSTRLLSSYLKLVVRASHARGAPATGGMAASLLPPASVNSAKAKEITAGVLRAKLVEIETGVDGFMVYDARLLPHVNELWKKHSPSANQISLPLPPSPSAQDLLVVPTGGVTTDGVKHNVAVSILFVYHWLAGVGHFFYKGCVEDSATAEISRWQIWQWLRFAADLEDSDARVTAAYVDRLCGDMSARAQKELCRSAAERKRMSAARHMAQELFHARQPPEFITTYLNDNHKFRTLHNKALLAAKSNL